ncbi:hypothetical protein CR156_14940 [Stenotrophomonas lactitubi]|uniref:hypothetical protein n=1 Tax=Stenotrophomonas TaxID=40323 RepID=UPI000C278241|nr:MULTISPECIES: hypothetical protein [Stenotrophomonas]MBA0250496.1 hypothetical protein [Stenotrophomonas maltophilia]MBA0320008.1 hypothetical protein [Stenotrophomonas maltophilia]PJO53378.1 hypothetical protein CR156_14940 [Stenotrophomonas lactitubi]
MSRRFASLIVVGDKITLVQADVPDDESNAIVITLDDTWKLQKDGRPDAYDVLYKRCTSYFSGQKIDQIVIKASAVSQGSATMALLRSAETRGVVIAAAASTNKNVAILSKAGISKTYGDRKVDEYISDENFWKTHTQGAPLRKASREGAVLILAQRSI